MARIFTRTARNYSPGTYGPFSLDSFTRNDTEKLRLDLTVEGWPAQENLARIRVTWGNGHGAVFAVSGVLPTYPDGTTPSVLTYTVGIPKDRDGRRQVTQASATIEVFTALRTAVTFRAL